MSLQDVVSELLAERYHPGRLRPPPERSDRLLVDAPADVAERRRVLCEALEAGHLAPVEGAA